MPPIRKGDGTPVEPKGVSQIRTGDGRILFDGPAIPDAAVLRYPFIEGSGTTVTETIEGQDGTISGAGWVSNNWQEGWALDGDGTDDYVDLTSGDYVDYGSKFALDGGLAFTIETTDDEADPFGWRPESPSPGDQAFYCTVGRFSSISNGQFGFLIEDQDGVKQIIDSGTTVNDGQKYRIFMWSDGVSASDKYVFINAADKTSIVDDDGNQDEDSFGNWGTSAPILATSDVSDSRRDHIDATVDDVIYYLDRQQSVTDLAQEDYDLQPWS